MAQMFNKVKLPSLPRSRFDLSYKRDFAIYMGELFPCFVQEIIPNDFVKLGNQSIIRLQPLVSPLMHRLSYDVRYFFVPNRIVDPNFETLINGFSQDINSTDATANSFEDNSSLIPHFDPTTRYYYSTSEPRNDYTNHFSLWEAFGFPRISESTTKAQLVNSGFAPVSYMWRAYNSIYNYFYRDENIIEEVDLDSDKIQWSAYSKNDYFLSALPFPQKGITPTMSFNIQGLAPVILGTSHPAYGSYDTLNLSTSLGSPSGGIAGTRIFNGTSSANANANSRLGAVSDMNKVNIDLNTGSSSDPYASRGLWADGSGLSGGNFSAEDLREMFAIQEFLELNSLSGTRFAEFIQAHFGAYTGDYRLGKPQYLCGFKNEIVVTDIPQTATDIVDDRQTPVGTLRGKGVGASSNISKSFKFSEHGYIIGIFRILPDVEYQPQGFDKKFIKNSFLDWYFPTFAHLGEEPIRRGELYYTGNSVTDNQTFGYQGAYAEYRHNRSFATGYMANTMSYWNLARGFSSSPALNADFIECRGNSLSLMRPFAVQSEPPFVVSCGNICSASRVMPTYATPAKIVR